MNYASNILSEAALKRVLKYLYTKSQKGEILDNSVVDF